MILPRHTEKLRYPEPHLHMTYFKRRYKIKEPPKAILLSNCEQDINFIRNSIFISANSTRSTGIKFPEFHQRSRPLSVERVKPNLTYPKSFRVTSQPGSRLQAKKENFESRLASEEVIWGSQTSFFKLALHPIYGILPNEK